MNVIQDGSRENEEEGINIENDKEVWVIGIVRKFNWGKEWEKISFFLCITCHYAYQ